MSFEDLLRNNTKTQSEINNERVLEQKKTIKYFASIIVQGFIMACKGAAASGRCSISFGIPQFNDNTKKVCGNYINNDAYINDCYRCAKLNLPIHCHYGLLCPCNLQCFNTVNEMGWINTEVLHNSSAYCFPKGYAEQLMEEIRLELKNKDFVAAEVFVADGAITTEHRFLGNKRIKKAFVSNGTSYFYMGIRTEW